MRSGPRLRSTCPASRSKGAEPPSHQGVTASEASADAYRFRAGLRRRDEGRTCAHRLVNVVIEGLRHFDGAGFGGSMYPSQLHYVPIAWPFFSMLAGLFLVIVVLIQV